MGVMDIFKSFFGNNNQVRDIINITDMVQIPTRDYFNDNEEVINLIDKYKNEYIKLLSLKKLLLSRELSFDNIHDKVKMYIDLLLCICIRDDEVIEQNKDIENKNINMIVQMTKLKLYLNSFYELEKDVMTRLISLREVMNEHKWLYVRNRNVINEEVNNLSSIIVMFMSQKMAIEKEINAYFKEVENQVIVNDLSSDKKDELIKDKLNELLEMAYQFIPDKVDYINILEVSDLIKISYLEKEIEIYVYKNKNVVDGLKDEFELLDKEEKNVQNKQKLVEQIKKLENQYKLFYKYGRKVITDDDMYDLYRVKFDIMTIDICGKQPLFVINSSGIEYECYKDIVFKKLEKIYRGENEVIKTIFGNDSVRAIKIIKKSLKLGYGEDDIEWIMKYYLDYVLAFDKEDGFQEYLLKHKRDRSKYDFNYYEDSFTWEDELSLDTLFYLYDLDNLYEEIKFFGFDLYLSFLNYYMSDYKRHKEEYRFPEGLIKIKIDLHRNNLYHKLYNDVQGKIVIFPESLKSIECFSFYNTKALVLNDNLICFDCHIQTRNLFIPSSVEVIKWPVSRLDNIVFENFEESEFILDVNNFEFVKNFFLSWTFDKNEYFTNPVISKDEDINQYKVKLSERHFKYIRHLYPRFKKLILVSKEESREIVIDSDLLCMDIEVDVLDKEYKTGSFNDNECMIAKKKILEVIERETGYKFDKVKKLEKKK